MDPSMNIYFISLATVEEAAFLISLLHRLPNLAIDWSLIQLISLPLIYLSYCEVLFYILNTLNINI